MNLQNYKNTNFIAIKTNLITNFKPLELNNFKNFNLLKKNRIFCKNFLFYLILLKYKNTDIFVKSNIFIKKYKSKVYTILKSPYRHKLARHQISINRYNLYFSIFLKMFNNIYIKNWKILLNLILFLKKVNKIFETNIIFVVNLNIDVPFYYRNNFLLKNFIKKKIKNK